MRGSEMAPFVFVAKRTCRQIERDGKQTERRERERM